MYTNIVISRERLTNRLMDSWNKAETGQKWPNSLLNTLVIPMRGGGKEVICKNYQTITTCYAYDLQSGGKTVYLKTRSLKN